MQKKIKYTQNRYLDTVSYFFFFSFSSDRTRNGVRKVNSKVRKCKNSVISFAILRHVTGMLEESKINIVNNWFVLCLQTRKFFKFYIPLQKVKSRNHYCKLERSKNIFWKPDKISTLYEISGGIWLKYQKLLKFKYKKRKKRSKKLPLFLK